MADALFREGAKLLEAGRVHEACEKFSESNRVDPQLGTLLNLATCHEREERTATALAEFNELRERAQQRGDARREQYARAHAEALEKRASRIRVELAPGASIDKVDLDGTVISAAALGTPLPLDPGTHTLTASTPGKRPSVQSFKVGIGPSEQTVTIASLVDAPSAGLAAAEGPTAKAQPAFEDAHAGATERSSARRTAGFVVGGVGLVGVGVGAVLGVVTLSKKSEVDAGCNGAACTSDGFRAQESAHTTALISDIAFGVGIVALAAGTYLILTAPGKSRPPVVQAGLTGFGGTW